MLNDRCKDVTAESLVVAGFPVSLRSRKQSSSARTTGFPRGFRAAVRFWTQWVSCPGPNVARAIRMWHALSACTFSTHAHTPPHPSHAPFFRSLPNRRQRKGQVEGRVLGERRGDQVSTRLSCVLGSGSVDAFGVSLGLSAFRPFVPMYEYTRLQIAPCQEASRTLPAATAASLQPVLYQRAFPVHYLTRGF